MASDGWIKLWRKLLENEVLQHETRFAVFVRLLLKAAHEPGSVWFKGQVRSVDKAQCWISERDEAAALKCDRQKIRSGLTVLQKAGMLTRDQTQGATKVTICKYEYYQSRELAANPHPNPATNPDLTQAKPTEQEGEEGKKGEGRISKRHLNGGDEARRREFDREFVEVFWPAYPAKTAKKDAKKAYHKARGTHPLETIMTGLELYKQTKPPDRNWMHAATFLNRERFNDEHGSDQDGRAQPASGGGGRGTAPSVGNVGRRLFGDDP